MWRPHPASPHRWINAPRRTIATTLERRFEKLLLLYAVAVTRSRGVDECEERFLLSYSRRCRWAKSFPSLAEIADGAGESRIHSGDRDGTFGYLCLFGHEPVISRNSLSTRYKLGVAQGEPLDVQA